MQFGKIRIEDGQLIFKKHMIENSLPCCDILWAYRRKECLREEGASDYTMRHSIVVITRRKKKYRHDMPEREAIACLEQIRKENPLAAIGFPTGSRIPLESLPNTRDLGAMITESGKTILPKKLLRSGELYHVSRWDQKVLREDYHLRTVIDFRTEAERKNKPDTFMEGVRYVKNPILDEDTVAASIKKSILELVLDFQGDGDQFMEEMYRNLVLDEISTKQYAKFFDVLLNQGDGSVLWHCSAGKDRAGVGTALLLTALGVSRKDVLADYTRTNRYLQDEAEYMVRYVSLQRDLTEPMEQNLRLLYQVKESYLQKVFQVIEEEYGTVERYLRKRIYLTPKSIEELQNKYLV